MGNCRWGLLFLLAFVVSCKDVNVNNAQKDVVSTSDSVMHDKPVFDDYRENLPLSIQDTIVRSTVITFSNPMVKDSLLLKVWPGKVKTAKAVFQIWSLGGQLMYQQLFDAYYFMRGIFDPDTTLAGGGQQEYDQLIENYRKGLTKTQYEQYFSRSVDSFFTCILPMNVTELEGLVSLDDAQVDRAFWQEVVADTSIRLLCIPCFDCDEGGVVVGYSRKRGRVITLLESD
jgi:hypothetical protein